MGSGHDPNGSAGDQRRTCKLGRRAGRREIPSAFGLSPPRSDVLDAGGSGGRIRALGTRADCPAVPRRDAGLALAGGIVQLGGHDAPEFSLPRRLGGGCCCRQRVRSTLPRSEPRAERHRDASRAGGWGQVGGSHVVLRCAGGRSSDPRRDRTRVRGDFGGFPRPRARDAYDAPGHAAPARAARTPGRGG